MEKTTDGASCGVLRSNFPNIYSRLQYNLATNIQNFHHSTSASSFQKSKLALHTSVSRLKLTFWKYQLPNRTSGCDSSKASGQDHEITTTLPSGGPARA
jgi:hypothetical protein